jgi:hypothetical protein
MKCAAFRTLVKLKVIEKVIDDLAVIKTHLRKFAALDRDDFVNMPGTAGIPVIDGSIVGIVFFWMRRRFHAAKRGIVPVHLGRFATRLEPALYAPSEMPNYRRL